MRTLLAMLETEEAHEFSTHVRDAWTTVCASIGSRTSGKPKGEIAIVGLGGPCPIQRDVKTFDSRSTLTIYIQHDSPGRARESNCVSAPRGHFILSMRLYRPGPEILGDAWTPPAIEHI